MAVMKGKLLALAWMMPPLVFPRSLQVSRTLKALGEMGWDTTVVTIVPEAEPLASVDHELARFYAGAYRKIIVETREEVEPSPWWIRVWRRINRVQDITVRNWKRRAGRILRAEIKAGQYDALITFAQPWVDHVVGVRIKRKYPAMPWIAHFSDPWVDSPYAHFATPEARDIAMRQEREIIELADTVIFVNQYTADLVMAKYPPAWRAKVHLVAHGFDDGLLPLVSQASRDNNCMKVVHTGNFYGHRSPEFILHAIRQLLVDADVRDHLRVDFIGHVEERFVAAASEMGLDGVVCFSGKADYLQSLAAAKNADLLLLVDAPAEKNVFLPSKIVDYFLLRRPILGITPASGPSANVLHDLGCPVVEPEDVTAISKALGEAFRRWQAGLQPQGMPMQENLEAFEIRQTTRDFERAVCAALKR